VSVRAKPAFLGPDELARIFSVEEFEPLAAERMDPAWYDAVRGWAGTGWTTRANVAAFGRWVFRPRVLVDVSQTTLETSVLGERVAMPILFAPSASHRLSHPDGELATARAAAHLETVQVLSLYTTVAMEEVAAVGHRRWLQLYW
jgi:isopentenyl diphosphate isomerase/L-lactate dehydrogenase-like FMN-dependent dehydrogenase